jgi:hypothetical protein
VGPEGRVVTVWGKRFAKLRDDGVSYPHALLVWRMLNSASAFGSSRTSRSAYRDLMAAYRVVPKANHEIDTAIEVACHVLTTTGWQTP